MGVLTVAGASAMCTMGQTPQPIKVTSQSMVLAGGKPAATISDMASMANVGPFGMCTSMANPQVAAATAAALGVLTPQPCVPAITSTWPPTQPKVILGGQPCLCNDSKLPCTYGGVISIVDPGQMKVVTG